MIWAIGGIALAATGFFIGLTIGFARGLRAGWSDHQRSDDE